MARTWQQVWLAALIITVLCSSCVLSCVSAAQPAAKADPHACCKKNQKQETKAPEQNRECHDTSSELAKAPVQVAAPAPVAVAVADYVPLSAQALSVSELPVYSPPDLLSLHQTLLI